MAYRTLTQPVDNLCSKAVIEKNKNQQKKSKKLELALAELQDKNELIRNLKIKMSEL